ncbi:hypothetical protein [Diaphorobacter nitroreducens]|uniref:hypothetical protein n=1 Tax=Diaphorobacter nitroreducens TaxID=164759 RepID=UPI00289E5FB4|nr:hypothetical protein [Diaphorobacter nitroreducens]
MTAHPSPNAVNTQLLRVLGITATDITAADIELRPGLYPLVTYSQVVRTLRLPTNGELREELHRYRLVPEAQPTFNLDAMCEQAREAVAKTAYDAWLTHLAAIKEDFEPLRRKAGERLLQRAGDVLTLQAGGAA